MTARQPAATLDPAAPFAAFPSWCPVFRLDRIFCWPPKALVRSFVDRSARRASDHLPVIADIAVD